MQYRELSASPENRNLLRRFYRELYVSEFPDPDERESLENMERYLERKASGWYGPNNYHVILVLADDTLIGGSISDYLAEPNAGVIEFLVVAPAWRRRGVGRSLLEETEKRIGADSVRHVGRASDYLIAEMEDPFKLRPSALGFDPFERTMVWARWGFRKLDVPYIQPALSPEQKPVTHLMLLVKSPLDRADAPHAAVQAHVVTRIVHEYLRWAMRIPDPEHCAEFRTMRRHLDGIDAIKSVSLLDYVGRSPERTLSIREVSDASDPDVPGVVRAYQEAFPVGPTTVEPEAFAAAIGRHRRPEYVRHLWAIRSSPDGPVQGMASFFTFPAFGFGGYVALGRSLRGTGQLRPLLARIEERMVRDERGARGWYIECDPAGPQSAIFAGAGFRQVSITYRQPPLRLGNNHRLDQTPILQLMYKEFGRPYHDPTVTRHEFLAALEWIYRVIYFIDEPRRHPLFQEIEQQTDEWPHGVARFHAMSRCA